MYLYDLQERRVVNVDADTGAKLLQDRRYQPVPSQAYAVGSRDGDTRQVSGRDLPTYLGNDYSLLREQPEGLRAKPEEAPGEVSGSAPFYERPWSTITGVGEDLAVGFGSQFLGGIGSAIAEEVSPEAKETIEKTRREGGLAYRAGQVGGFVADFVPAVKIAGAVTRVAQGSKLARNVLKTINKTKAGKTLATGFGYGATFSGFSGTAEYIRTKDAWAVAEHAIWGGVLGATGGIALQKAGAGVSKVSGVLGRVAKRSNFSKITGVNEESLVKQGVTDKATAKKIVDNQIDILDKGIRAGELKGNSTKDDFLDFLDKSLSKMGKEIGLDKKIVKKISEDMSKTFNHKLALEAPQKIANYGNSVENHLNMLAKLDSLYRLGITKFQFTKNVTVGKALDDLSRINTQNISKYAEKFDYKKYTQDLIEFDRVINKTADIVRKSKKINPKDKAQALKDLKSASQTIDDFLKGKDFKKDYTLKDIATAFNRSETKMYAEQFRKMGDDEWAKVIESSNTSEDFVKMIKATYKIEGKSFSGFKEKLKDTPLEKIANDSVNVNDFVGKLRETYRAYQFNVKGARRSDKILEELKKIITPEGLETMPGPRGTLYRTMQREIGKSRYLSHEKLNGLRKYVGEDSKSAFKKSGYEDMRLSESVRVKVYNYLRKTQTEARRQEFEFYKGVMGQQLHAKGTAAYNALNRRFSEMSKVRETVNQSILHPEREMGEIVLGYTTGAGIGGVLGGVLGGGPLGMMAGAVLGGLTGYAGSKMAPKVANAAFRRYYFQARPFFSDIENRMNRVEGYLNSPTKWNNVFRAPTKGTGFLTHRSKDRGMSEVAEFLGTSSVSKDGSLDFDKMSMEIERTLADPERASQVTAVESDILRSNEMSEVANATLARKLHAMSTLSKLMPRKSSGFFNRKGRKYSEQDTQDFLSVFNVVSRPEDMFKLIAQGSVTRKQVEVFKQLYPSLYGAMSLKLSEMIQEGKEFNYRQRQTIKKFLGMPEPPDLSFRPQGDQGLPIDDTGESMVNKTVKNLGKTRERSLERVESL